MRTAMTRCACELGGALPRARLPNVSAPRWRRSGSTDRPAAAACAVMRRSESASSRSCSSARACGRRSRCWKRTVKRKLHELAHARAGDKGDTLTLALISYREGDYPLLRERGTAEAVKWYFRHIAP